APLDDSGCHASTALGFGKSAAFACGFGDPRGERGDGDVGLRILQESRAADLPAETPGACPLHRLPRHGYTEAAGAPSRRHHVERRTVASELRRLEPRGRAG